MFPTLLEYICVWYVYMYMLVLLLSRFSCVWLCATPQTAAHQASPSLRFSRQEHWSGLPFPSPIHESEKSKWSRSVVSDSPRPHGLQPTRLLHPWDFPGKSTGVGRHCLLHLFVLNQSKLFGFLIISFGTKNLLIPGNNFHLIASWYTLQDYTKVSHATGCLDPKTKVEDPW